MTRPHTNQFVDDNREPREWLQAAEALSREVVHVDARTAYRRVRAGEFEGTAFAAELSQLMWLAGEDSPLPDAAE